MSLEIISKSFLDISFILEEKLGTYFVSFHCFHESDPHEEFPLSDEELSGRQRAETLIHHNEEESARPENTQRYHTSRFQTKANHF